MPNVTEQLPGVRTASPVSPFPAQAASLESPRLIVGIATRGRPAVLAETLAGLRGQTLTPTAVLVSYAQPEDVGEAPGLFPEVTFLLSPSGLTRQRNTILKALPAAEVLVFFDDDFFLRPDYLRRMQEVFAAHPSVVVATGRLIADGINGPGFTTAEGQGMLARFDRVSPVGTAPWPVFNAYGCNMALRLVTVQANHLRFNEDLPLYGWYEDVEFSRQMARFGDVVKVPTALGVHLGVKGGRQSGVRLGYSQVANPVYLARRQSVPWRYALASMGSRSAKNLVRSLWPEPFVDRRGRLRGNLQAWRDLVKGRIHPQRAAQL